MVRKKLPDPDQKLWQAVTDTVTPLVDRPKGAELPKRFYFEKEQEDTPLPADWYNGKARAPRPTLDKHNRRQIRSKKRPIDRSLDLHGMTQDQAYFSLKTNIERAVQQGMRTLIVVTGKGGKRWSQTDATSIAHRKRDDFDQYGGVLKRMVPLWLAGPDLSPFVHSYSEASAAHGGAGALYVLLRRQKTNSESADNRGVY